MADQERPTIRNFAPLTEFGEAQCKRCNFVYEMQTSHHDEWNENEDVPIVCEGCGHPVTCDWCEAQLAWRKRLKTRLPHQEGTPLINHAIWNLDFGRVFVWKLCPTGCIVHNPVNVNMNGNTLRDESIQFLEAGNEDEAIEKLQAALFHYRQTGLQPGIEWAEETLSNMQKKAQTDGD